MIRAIKTIKLDVTMCGKTGDFRERGTPHSSDSTCLRCSLAPAYTGPSPTPHAPFCGDTARGGAWGQTHVRGAFPGPVFPSSRWNFQRISGPRRRTPCRPCPRRRANLSTPGSVPGNSSISLSRRRLQETETQAPPPTDPPRGTGSRAKQSWVACPALPAAPPPAGPSRGGRLRADPRPAKLRV